MLLSRGERCSANRLLTLMKTPLLLMLDHDRDPADTSSAQLQAKCRGQFSECNPTRALHDEPSGDAEVGLRGVEGSRLIAAKPIEHYRNGLVSLLTFLDVMRDLEIPDPTCGLRRRKTSIRWARMIVL